MKGCFAFNKNLYEFILSTGKEDPLKAMKMLFDYIDYGLYNNIRKDIDRTELYIFKKIFKNRDISKVCVKGNLDSSYIEWGKICSNATSKEDYLKDLSEANRERKERNEAESSHKSYYEDYSYSDNDPEIIAEIERQMEKND